MSSWGFGVVRAEIMTAPQSVIADICDLLTAATGERFIPQFAETYRELAATIGAGSTGLAWMPPIPAVELEESGMGIVLALPARKGSATYHSALIARKGAGKKIEDFKGKTVAWVDRASASGYVIPRLHLASLGIDVPSFFSKDIFAKTHMGVVDAVVAGRVDARRDVLQLRFEWHEGVEREPGPTWTETMHAPWSSSRPRVRSRTTRSSVPSKLPLAAARLRHAVPRRLVSARKTALRPSPSRAGVPCVTPRTFRAVEAHGACGTRARRLDSAAVRSEMLAFPSWPSHPAKR